MGYALGDALGLGTEFMTRNEVESYYPDGLRRFDQIIRDVHRSQWDPGETTNDTVLLVRFIETLLQRGQFKLHDMALSLKEWMDLEGDENIPAFNLFYHDPSWLDNPIASAHRNRVKTSYEEATNETLQRGILTGLTSSDDELMEHTRRFVLMTHDDSRCVSSTKIIAKMVHSLLNKEREATADELMNICMQNDMRTIPFLEHALNGDIDKLKVDNEHCMMWTRVSMGAALWGFLHTDNASDAIFKVIDLGGDADTNAALSGALAGLKYGYDALPDEKERLKNLDALHDLSERLTAHIEKSIEARNRRYE